MSSQQRTSPSVEHYRHERKPCSRELGRELARITDEIDDPVAKLRYLRSAIDAADDDIVRRLPHAGARRALYRLRGLEALDAVVDPVTGEPKVGERTLAARKRARRIAAGAMAATLLMVPALLTGLALQLDSKSTPLAQQAPSRPLSPLRARRLSQLPRRSRLSRRNCRTTSWG